MENVIILYIGPPSSPHLMHILLCHACCSSSSSSSSSSSMFACVQYDPCARACPTASSSSSSIHKKVNQTLMRRYYLVQQAKASQIVGILVGTLGVAHYMDLVNELRTAVQASGRKAYVFVVGKINVPKLANYAEIDVFVLVACPENSMLDSKEFYKPIVTPYEMSLALDHHRAWTGEYHLDFHKMLTCLTTLEPQSEHDPEEYNEEDEEEDDKPYFSLVTGTFEALPQSQARAHVNLAYEHDNDNDNDNDVSEALVQPSSKHMTNFVSPAGEFLSSRVFQGLDPRLGQDAAHSAQIGSSGIAKQYHSL